MVKKKLDAVSTVKGGELCVEILACLMKGDIKKAEESVHNLIASKPDYSTIFWLGYIIQDMLLHNSVMKMIVTKELEMALSKVNAKATVEEPLLDSTESVKHEEPSLASIAHKPLPDILANRNDSNVWMAASQTDGAILLLKPLNMDGSNLIERYGYLWKRGGAGSSTGYSIYVISLPRELSPTALRGNSKQTYPMHLSANDYRFEIAEVYGPFTPTKKIKPPDWLIPVPVPPTITVRNEAK